ncbi:H-NS family nucleoid-associated regulatory protein [uncultured Roseobacter sp.]|uniref:H-NS family nucleoid-associated regulatory protein n=1 Tax=uncultured Roseobacter sp. TaxID=114847 RepID=UPI002632CD03|nr:H-NS family nucleoid-associated regulatory protein [uncultured Roseobacter sp.]
MADLSKMSRKQLERLITDAQRALKSIETKEKREAKKAAEKAAAKFGFKLSELTNAPAAAPKPKSAAKKATPAKKPAAAAKYANPANPAQTWSGMGRQPRWFKDAVASGVDPKTLEI